ncbi:hypothetical protein LTR64_006883 [Lithohypha guttulata]|uniref:uncharacterized protein n=1 Tax=Lithohypha guttulata TaxID=1690604 RepID=UPI002DE1BC84|nr:hypothetical protein LTR51_004559 [Lithohypha guttulata]
MQKTLRINLLARNQAAKVFHKKERVKFNKQWHEYKRQKNNVDAKRGQYVREERSNRREDWLLGPLAPNRDSGTNRGSYGAIEVDLFHPPEIPFQTRGGPKIAGYEARDWEEQDEEDRFKGETIVGNVIENDRVVIVHGPEHLRGRVDYVQAIDPKSESVRLRTVNMADVRIPDMNLAALGNVAEAPKFETMTAPIPMSWVRLCHEMIDPATGQVRQAIVRHVHGDAPYAQRAPTTNIPAHTRYITGSAVWSSDGKPIEIPWPSATMQDTPQATDTDTEEKIRSDMTWRPQLLNPPLGYVPPIHDANASNIPDQNDPRTRYTAGALQPDNRPSASNIERAGLHGFVNSNKAMERQQRIVRGILQELKPQHRRDATMHDDPDWVRRKMLEDARAIWWKDRMMSASKSPATQAIEQEVQKRREQRQEAMAQHMQDLESFRSEIKAQRELKEKEKEQEASLLATKKTHGSKQVHDFASLITEVQQLTVARRYKKPDAKFRKRLARM